jgi:hypothetical protein
MSQVINIQDARYSRAALEQPSAEKIGAKAHDTGFSAASQPSISKGDVHRAILLLDIAAQQARLLVREIADPPRRKNFEAQIATIEQLLQIAREMASKLWSSE